MTPVTASDQTLHHLAATAVADAVNELSVDASIAAVFGVAIRNLRADAGLGIRECIPLVDEAIRERAATRNTDRRLLAAVSRWAHANGWERDVLPEWWHSRDRLINVWWGRCSNGALRIERLESRYGHPLIDVSIPDVTSVRLAVDLLVAYGILPAEFSSAFQAGRASAGCAA